MEIRRWGDYEIPAGLTDPAKQIVTFGACCLKGDSEMSKCCYGDTRVACKDCICFAANRSHLKDMLRYQGIPYNYMPEIKPGYVIGKDMLQGRVWVFVQQVKGTEAEGYVLQEGCNRAGDAVVALAGLGCIPFSDVVEIYAPRASVVSTVALMDLVRNGECSFMDRIYKRTKEEYEVMELTHRQLEQHFGRKIRIVEDEK